MTLILEAQTIVQRTRETPFSQLDDELLAIDVDAGYCYSLNATAGRVWELIAAPVLIQVVCAQLRREYAVDEATCLAEVIALLQGLYEAGLVQVNG